VATYARGQLAEFILCVDEPNTIMRHVNFKNMEGNKKIVAFLRRRRK
jgi:hypothetical protein